SLRLQFNQFSESIFQQKCLAKSYLYKFRHLHRETEPAQWQSCAEIKRATETRFCRPFKIQMGSMGELEPPWKLNPFNIPALEMNPEAKLELTRSIRLRGDMPKGLRRIDIQARRAGLEMVQHIGELGQKSHPHTLGEFEFLGHAQIEVPLGQVI